MKSSSCLYLLILCSAFNFLSVVSGNAAIDSTTKDKVPPIAYIQGMIWKRLDLADFTLNGTVRSDKTKKHYPITLLTHGHELVYEFQDQPIQIRVELNPGAFTVEKRASNKDSWTPVSSADRLHSILNTDITYEDLGIDFVNWDDVTPLGTDSIKTLDAYVFDAKPGPNDHSRFAKVRYWVSSQYWCFLRIDGLNNKDQTIKRVEAQDVIKIGKYNVFKEMKVATMAPDRNDIALSTTFIDIADGHEGSGLK
jgi:outer membrane lipoprotein-sorting protein